MPLVFEFAVKLVVWPEQFSWAELQLLFLIGCETMNITQTFLSTHQLHCNKYAI
jgi:hypothetical protein